MQAFEQTLTVLNSYLEYTWVQSMMVLGSFVLLGIVVWLFITNILRFIGDRAGLSISEMFIENVRAPITFSLMVTGVQEAIEVFEPPEGIEFATAGVMFSAVVLVWMNVSRKLMTHFLRKISLREGATGFFCLKTLPLTTLLSQAFIYLIAGYCLMRAWGIDATAWLASAGVLGVAIGFAAQNSLSDLLAGISIITDPPFEVGDFVEIDETRSGIVKTVGLRTTRLWTLDDVELILPNSMITSQMVTNATAGPKEQQRLQIPITLEYGGDIDQQTALLRHGADVEGILPTPEPKVWLRTLGDFGVEFVINVWVEKSQDIEPCRDRINRKVIKVLDEAGVSVPFPRYDLQMVEPPTKD